ncbi:hypothetical protein BGX38DRAFT_1272048 [Terfezia claveryi]|nr:hypothetical protein BGX38DRAFT_1272048 [Terfezia claveryi]
MDDRDPQRTVLESRSYASLEQLRSKYGRTGGIAPGSTRASEFLSGGLQHPQIQTTTYVERISDEELNLVPEMDPEGMVTMSTKMVEMVTKDAGNGKWQQLATYVNSLSDQERTYLMAMADKRVREEDDEETPPSQRAKRMEYPAIAYKSSGDPSLDIPDFVGQSRAGGAAGVPQNLGDTSRASMPNQSKNASLPHNTSFPQSSPEASTIPRRTQGPENTFTQPLAQPFIPNPFYDIPANQYQPQFIPTAAIPKSKKNRKNPEPKLKRHIKMMRGQDPWDPVESLRRLPVVGLDFGSLFDMAPEARIAVGKALQMEKPLEARAQKQKEQTKQNTPDAPVNSVGMEQRITTDREGGTVPSNEKGVLQEPTCHIMNFHIIGEIWGKGYRNGRAYEVGQVLIDGGAVVNLMPEGVANRLGLELRANDDIVIRTATDETRPIHQCINFDLDIAGVVAYIRAYVIDIPQLYSLLLGRRWLYQVWAFGNYAAHSYTIYDSTESPHKVYPIGSGKRTFLLEIMLNPYKQLPHTDLTDIEKEEIHLRTGKIEAIINRIVSEAELQSRSWGLEEDSELEGESSDEEEEEKQGKDE